VHARDLQPSQHLTPSLVISVVNAAASVAFILAFLLAMVLMSRRRSRLLIAFISCLLIVHRDTIFGDINNTVKFRHRKADAYLHIGDGDRLSQ
jgi:hypothetical protein